MNKCISLIVLSVCFIMLNGCNKGPKPVAAFTMEPTNALAGDTIRFSNQSTDATSFSWDFGDDSVSTLENPIHQFAEGGTFSVALTATGEGGKNTATHDITLLPSLTGKWSSTFTYYSPINGTLNLVQHSDGTLTGQMVLQEGSTTPMQLGSTSKITGTSVTIEAVIQGYKYTYKGTINANYDFITGNFFMDGQHFGNWYATKIWN